MLFIVASFLILTLLPGPVLAAPKIISKNGSLVIETPDARRSVKKSGSQDTLCALTGREVHAFIFRNQVQVWPRIYVRSAPGSFRGHVSSNVESLIDKYARFYGVDPGLIRAVMRHESGFNPTAVSPKGAQGLMQLMPGTAALMGVRNPFDPEQNIAGGVGYLRFCLDRFQHNVPLAVAAYNAGPESVAKYGTVPPYLETQTFVSNVMGSYTGSAAAHRRSPKTSGRDDPKTKDSLTKRHRRRPKIIEVRPRRSKSEKVAVIK
ncbi:MAG TPA: lytic transglycosylase domain-containing protein [Desulfobaccales bacterium]|nr:lytic transglycosylase domain-containing protein [Desulfobaccales bacterium]